MNALYSSIVEDHAICGFSVPIARYERLIKASVNKDLFDEIRITRNAKALTLSQYRKIKKEAKALRKNE